MKLVQFATFVAAIYNLAAKAGGRLASKAVIDKRLAICKECEHFTGRGCKLCGCCSNSRRSLFNKLAFPSERCPDVPPRFEEEK